MINMNAIQPFIKEALEDRKNGVYIDSNINTEFNLFSKLIKNTDNIMTIHNSIDKEHALL
jgi:hypothetical protein